MSENIIDFSMRKIARDENLVLEDAAMDIWLAQMDGCSVYADNIELANSFVECPDKKHEKANWLRGVIETKLAFELYKEHEFDAMIKAVGFF